jgi:IclR family pca regulon transcriptional regulator
MIETFSAVPLKFDAAPRPQSNEMFVDAFARGLEVIRSFSDSREKQTISDVARYAGISRASTRRLLHTLMQLGYVHYDGKYFSLKPKILDLGYAYMSSLDLAAVARDAMNELAETMNSSCSLSILDGFDVVYIHRAMVRLVTACRNNVGARMPAHLLGMGRVQLAALDDETLRRRLSSIELVQHTPYTVTDPKRLFDIIRADGKQGWSIVRRELDEGICSIAMPVRGKQDEIVAGMGVALRPDLSNDPKTIAHARSELAKAVTAVGDLLRMRP